MNHSTFVLGKWKKALLLAIDDVSLPLKKNLCLYLSKPRVRAEPVLTPSPIESNAPDHLSALFYGTVLHDEGHFRLWYHACHWGMNPDWPPAMARQFARYKDPVLLGPACYAESDDGIHWLAWVWRPPASATCAWVCTACGIPNPSIRISHFTTREVNPDLRQGKLLKRIG
ncbi:MAG: hypothetical protein HY360_22320 [Verrucomicrobia bacterium]|nr:hypothetical protein [Verrucomicrobiota bacterium]